MTIIELLKEQFLGVEVKIIQSSFKGTHETIGIIKDIRSDHDGYPLTIPVFTIGDKALLVCPEDEIIVL